MQQKNHTVDPSLVLASVVCTVIGVGIFYKNEGVFTAAQNNWATVLSAWLLVSFICVCTALSYSRIAVLHNTDLGFCGWAETVVGPGFSRFVSRIYILFKLGICIPAFCLYAASSFLKIFQLDSYLLGDGMGKFSSLGLIFAIGTLILAGSMAFNYLRPDGSILIQRIFMYSKFVPIAMAVLFGVVISAMRGSGGLFTGAQQSRFSMANALVAAPGIMMAFDAFLNAGFYANRLRDPKRQIPRIYMLSIGFFIALYLVITVNQLLCGRGSAQDIFSPDQLGPIGSRTVTGIFLFFVFLSAVGLVNGYSNTMITVVQKGFEDGILPLKRRFLRRFREPRRAAFAFWIALSSFWLFVMASASLLTGSDAVLDGLTNVPTLFMFSVYGAIAGAYGWKLLRERREKRPEGRELHSLILSVSASAVSCIGWMGISLYQFLYICIYLPANDLGGEFNGWRGPWNSGIQIQNWHAALMVLVCLTAALGLHLISGRIRSREMARAGAAGLRVP